MSRPHPRQNPARGIAASRASASTLRPCAPTDAPFATSRMYACSTRHCGSWVELAPSEPLPADWITVTIAAKKGQAARTGYRCGKCQRRQLVLTLLADDIALRTIAISDARRLASWAEAQGLDERGIRVVVGRLQAAHASDAWDAIVDRATGGMGEVDR